MNFFLSSLVLILAAWTITAKVLNYDRMLEIMGKGKHAKLNISVYYDTDLKSKEAMLEPLQNIVCRAQDYLNVQLIPFGTAHLNETLKRVFCLNEPQYCEKLILHNCVLNHLEKFTQEDPDVVLQKIDYVNCDLSMDILNEGKDWRVVEENGCIREIDYVSVERVRKCVSSAEGYNLLVKAETATREMMKVIPKSMPTIVFNGVYNQRISDKAKMDLELMICSQLTNIGLQKLCNFGRIRDNTIC